MTERELSAADRVGLERLRAISNQRLAGARELWRSGLASEALRLSADAVRRQAEALAAERRGEEVVSVLRDLDAVELPATDAEYTRAHAALLERVWSLGDRLDRALALRLDPEGARRRHRARIAASALSVALLGGAAALLRYVDPPVVRASASYSDETKPARATDGLADTDWLLPDGQAGWIELQFRRPRDVRLVRLLNSRNRHFLDRAAHRVTVSLRGPGGSLAQRDAKLGPPSASAPWIDVPVSARGVTRIKVELRSFHRLGGGLAEVAWEEF